MKFKWHPIRWLNNDYGTQIVPGMTTDHWCPRGYVKIWFNDPRAGPRVVDTALTVRRARELIRKRLPINENPS